MRRKTWTFLAIFTPFFCVLVFWGMDQIFPRHERTDTATQETRRNIFIGEKAQATGSFRSNHSKVIEIDSGNKHVNNPKTEFDSNYVNMKKDKARSDRNNTRQHDQISKHALTKTGEGDKQCQRRLPQCIIIGVTKCGTRALIDFLDIHPNIVGAYIVRDGRKKYESCYFGDNYNKGLNWYLNVWMPCTRSSEITIEKSPCYFYIKEAAARIKEADRNMKLLLAVKDPIERAMSSYVQQTEMNFNTSATFEEAVIDESGKIKEDVVPIHKSLYWEFLEPWLEQFGREQILVIDGNLLATKPHVELQRIEKFLGIPPYIQEDNFVFSNKKQFYCIKRAQDVNPLCLAPNKGRPHPKIRSDVLVKLQGFFKSHNERLFKMIGRHFDWGY